MPEIDTNYINKCMKYVNMEAHYTYCNKIVFFNVDGLRSNINSSKYRKIFGKDTISLVVKKRLINDKLTLLNELVNKHDKIIFAKKY